MRAQGKSRQVEEFPHPSGAEATGTGLFVDRGTAFPRMRGNPKMRCQLTGICPLLEASSHEDHVGSQQRSDARDRDQEGVERTKGRIAFDSIVDFPIDLLDLHFQVSQGKFQALFSRSGANVFSAKHLKHVRVHYGLLGQLLASGQQGLKVFDYFVRRGPEIETVEIPNSVFSNLSAVEFICFLEGFEERPFDFLRRFDREDKSPGSHPVAEDVIVDPGVFETKKRLLGSVAMLNDPLREGFKSLGAIAKRGGGIVDGGGNRMGGPGE